MSAFRLVNSDTLKLEHRIDRYAIESIYWQVGTTHGS